MNQRDAGASAEAVARDRFGADEDLRDVLARDEEFGAVAYLFEQTCLYVDAADAREHPDALAALNDAREALENALDAHYDRVVDGDGVYETTEARR